MAPGNLVDWIAFNLLPGMGPLQKSEAWQRFRDPGEIAFRVPVTALPVPGRTAGEARQKIVEARRRLRRLAERELRRAEKRRIRLLPLDDPDYPAAFETLPDAPVLLYVRGRIAPGIVRIAVVGSRRPTAYGRRLAVGVGSALAERGTEIVSGGARGIDSCAHQGALEANGTTVAVLGSGFDDLYPSEHERLFGRIAESGAVISEFPLDTPPLAMNFPRRNRLISGLSAAVVVVEATLRSGSLVTARHALEQGREVLAIPGPVHSEQSQGCHRLIQQGATLVQNTEDIVKELSPMYRQALGPSHEERPAERPAVGRTPDETAALGLLDDTEPVHIDALADRAPFGIARLQTALFGLVVRGDVEELAGGYYFPKRRKCIDA